MIERSWGRGRQGEGYKEVAKRWEGGTQQVGEMVRKEWRKLSHIDFSAI